MSERTTFDGVIAARIDRLPPRQAGAFAGRVTQFPRDDSTQGGQLP